MTSILEGQPPQNKAFSNQNNGHLASRYVMFFLCVLAVMTCPTLWPLHA